MKKLFFAFTILLLAVPCQARTITVDDDGIADFNNIQAAINDSNDGDIIVLSTGIYTGDGNRDVDFLGKAIIVCSVEPNDPDIIAATIIDCNASEADRHRGFHFHNNENSNSIVAGLTITNGYAPKEQIGRFIQSVGGAIFCESSSPTISNCIIEDNSAFAPYGYGAGIFCYGSTANIINCTIKHNAAMIGAGIFCLSSSPRIANCIIVENKAREYGGGIRCYGSSPQIINCQISNNWVDGSAYGGGIECYSSSPTVTGCIITGNSARWGGGIYCGSNSSPIITNCIICGNSARTEDGGAIYGHSSRTHPTITNCTINANSAGRLGGGICFRSGRPEITNCIIWANTAPDGPQIFARAVSVSCSDVQAGYPGPGNIDARPGFADPANGDYHLKSQAGRWNIKSQSWVQDELTSPCIDTGDPDMDWTKELWTHGQRINMGAYGGTPQASMSPSDIGNIADLNNDDKIDFGDLMLFAEQWLKQEALLPEDLNRNGIVDHTDYVIFVDNWHRP